MGHIQHAGVVDPGKVGPPAARRGLQGHPPGWPYMVILLAWAAGSAWVCVESWSLTVEHTVLGWRGSLRLAGIGIAAAAQSVALFYMLGFLAKSLTYLFASLRPSGSLDRGCPSPPLAVLYLTAEDFDEAAVDSLLRLEYSGPKLFILHDDGDDEETRARMVAFLDRHPSSRGWETRVWHRPRRAGGKAGAVNWVLERLDPRWEMLLLCDSDSIACDGTVVARAAGEFEDPSVAVVQFRLVGQVDPRAPSLLKRLSTALEVFDAFATPQSIWGYVPFLGHNAIVRASELRRHGGLTPGFFSDDLDFSIRLTLAGRRIVYRRDLVFAERHPPDLVAFRKRARKWARGCMQVMRARAPDVLTARGVPFAHRVGMLEFMGFYPAQALLLLGLITAHLILPWITPAPSAGPAHVLVGATVLAGIFAPTLAWSARHGRLLSWPLFAWALALVYGGSILATARGVADGLSHRERPWHPTNLTENRRAVPVAAWRECLLGLALVAVPWMNGSSLVIFPATYLFVASFVFAPLTFAAYRAPSEAPGRRSGPSLPSAAVRTSGTLGLFVTLLLEVLFFLPSPAIEASQKAAVRDGKVLVGGKPYYVRGIHYSPWLPGTGPGGLAQYPAAEVIERDLQTILSLGANTIYVQDSPPWVIERARAKGLMSLYTFTIPWNDTSDAAFEARADAILAQVDTLKDHEGILAWILGNEVPIWVVQQLGASVIEDRLRSLAERVRARDPGRLLGHANWPPTKDLDLRFLDLACFNLYPAWPYEVSVRGFGPYLREVLAPLAGDRPLLITEFGINSLEAGESRQAQVLSDCWREIQNSPAIGGVVFGWADEWWKNFDNPIPGKGYWERAYDPDDAARHDEDPEEHYGIVRADRTPKPAFKAVKAMWGGKGPTLGLLPWLILAVLALGSWAALGLGRRLRAAGPVPAGCFSDRSVRGGSGGSARIAGGSGLRAGEPRR